jgi:recombinational DNA repair protein (RecF pathway)
MREIITKALVLDIQTISEADARVTLYTEELGRVVVRARSLFKSNSKLVAHLQPLCISTVRLVEKKNFQIVDALLDINLKTSRSALEVVELLEVARLIKETTHQEHPDADIWELIVSGQLLGRRMLRVLGFDPDFSTCHICRAKQPSYFILREGYYVCRSCLRKSTGASGYFELPQSVPGH